MAFPPKEILQKLMGNSANLRNICIVAHVDHGKTSLADYLLASNGIISSKNAGRFRLLDSRPDELDRKITMKTSVVNLVYAGEHENYLINLMDSPGHMDFSGEVHQATELADGALVVIDVAEGICAQTEAVMKQAFSARNTLILVLNKIDRLITELKMTPFEAYVLFSQLIEEANRIIDHLKLDKGDCLPEEPTQRYFDPLLGNVIFCSALDKWAFSLDQMASFYAPKLNLSPSKLLPVLWGDFYCDFRLKKVRTRPFARHKTPVFVALILAPLWQIYAKLILPSPTPRPPSQISASVSKASARLEIALPPAELNPLRPRETACNLFHRWLPVSRAVFHAAVQRVPPPAATRPLEETPGFFSGRLYKISRVSVADIKAPSAAHFQNQRFVYLATAKLFEGTLCASSKGFFIGPEGAASPFEVKALFASNGLAFSPASRVFAGNIFALEVPFEPTLRSRATFSSRCGADFIPLKTPISAPMLKVALIPKKEGDLEILREAVAHLCFCDSNALFVCEDQRIFLFVCGDIHLERCKRDLQDYLGDQTLFWASAPLAQFYETSLSTDRQAEASSTLWDDFADFGLNVSKMPFDTASSLNAQTATKPSLLEALGFQADSVAFAKIESANFNALILRDNFSLDFTSESPDASETSKSLLRRQITAKILCQTFRLRLAEIVAESFDIFCRGGPICKEPLRNVCVVVTRVGLKINCAKGLAGAEEKIKTLWREEGKGRMVAILIKSLFAAFKRASPRLVQPFYKAILRVPRRLSRQITSVVQRAMGRLLETEFGGGCNRLTVAVPVYEYGRFFKAIKEDTAGKILPRVLFDEVVLDVVDSHPFPLNGRELREEGVEKECTARLLGMVNSVRAIKDMKVLRVVEDESDEG